MTASRLLLLSGLLILFALPPQWYPQAARVQLSQWFGAAAFRPLPASVDYASAEAEVFCPPDLSGWRNERVIEGLTLPAVAGCVPDNPWSVATAIRGSNNVSADTLSKSGFTSDAVTKGRDLDGDGDPDEIHIRLEVVELNGASAEQPAPVTEYSLAPGIKPGLWVFAPKLAGMATENFESNLARPNLRLPSPTLRVEQGDRVYITLENTHYMPHTLHLHGADHGFVDSTGEGNDGVPITSEMPVMPGGARRYELTPRSSGTMFYHCHVQPHVHVMMGLQGLFIIEENRPDNWLQTINIGAGSVRHPSVAVRENYQQEYDLHYLDLDRELSAEIQRNNDPRLITRAMHREYDITDASSDYFVLNGRSFPYTFRESLIVTEPGQRTKLRVVNGGAKGIALHTHGHKFTVTHKDGSRVPEAARFPQDVVWLGTSQRADLELSSVNDGVSSYGAGIWPYHDHQYQGVTTDGIGPGGNISAIVYRDYLDDAGWPKTLGTSYTPYFTEEFYRKEIPVWEAYAPGQFSDPGSDWRLVLRIALLALGLGLAVAAVLPRRR